MTGDFYEPCEPIIEDLYRKKIELNGKTFLLDVLDPADIDYFSAGRERFTATREEPSVARKAFNELEDQWIREREVIFICFSITSRSSWEDVALYRRRLLRTKDEDDTDWGVVLIATKCDSEQFREVSKEEILETANKWNIPVVETSAKEKKNVEHMIVQGIYAYWVNSQTQCAKLGVD